jgi:ubiquinone/menaquinone biosynthesis C-methylase UbiE
MDEINKINRDRWNALAKANVEFTRPFLDYTVEDAGVYIYRHDILKDVAGKKVLCLASGGGQGSVAFGLLGADVTVYDLSDMQLARDRQGASHHNLKVETIQGDMRDLSIFQTNHFDVVWQAYSINFVSSVEPVFHEVARVLKPSGVYFLQFANPFVASVDDGAWDGNSYPLKHLYFDGEDVTKYFPHWDVDRPDGSSIKLESPHEFRHNMGTVMNTLVNNGFVFLGLWEWMEREDNPKSGTWAHFTQVAPPWFDSFWRRLHPTSPGD